MDRKRSSNNRTNLKKPRPIIVLDHNVFQNPNDDLEEKMQTDNTKTTDQISESPIRDVCKNNIFKSKVETFIEISKYFSSPLRKTASYICENCLVSFPSSYRIEYKRGGVTTEHIKFSNITLQPVYIRLFKLIPDLEQIKFINLSLSRCKRIPPGLSFNLGFMYDDVNEKPACNTKLIFVASRKTTTPCYQICEINIDIQPLKIRLISK